LLAHLGRAIWNGRQLKPGSFNLDHVMAAVTNPQGGKAD
jgi:hypothetical protein